MVLCVPPQSEIDEALKFPIVLQNAAKQIRIFAGEVTVDAVVRAHHRTSVGNAQTDVKSEKIAFLHGAFGDDGVNEIAAGLLVVDGVMLDVAEDVLRLETFEQITDHGSGENGIFAEIFEGAAIARFACKVGASAERHVKTLRS